MEDGDIVFVDSSGRNADRATVVRGQPSRAVVVPAGTSQRVTYASPPPAAVPWGYPQSPSIWGSMQAPFAQPPVYAQPPYFGAPGTLGSMFGNVNIGMLIDLIGEGFAAIRSLPTPPAPSGDVATDVVNSVTYDTALAQHAQTTEQIIAASKIVGKLLGA